MITRAIILLNVLVFLWEVRVGGSGLLSLGLGGNSNIDFSRIEQYTLSPNDVRIAHEYYRIFTAAFLHASISHIALNMFSLYWLGRFVEAALGSFKMAVLYVIAVIASGIAVVLFSPVDAATLGASGAVYGLFGAMFGVGMKLGARGKELVRSNIGILVLNLLFSFYMPGISWQAHLGGLIAGFLASLAMYWPPKPVYARVIDPQSGTQYESTLEEPADEHGRY